MAIRGGQILHTSQGFLIDRIQTGGVSNFNIPQTPVAELGNYKNVEIVRDIPTLTFDLESLDVTTETEALLLHRDPSDTIAGEEFDFLEAIPMDIISPFKSTQGAFDVVKGIGVGYLTLGSASYKFGVGANATQTFTLNGDVPYYIPGTPKDEEFTVVAAANHTYTISETAIVYTEQGFDRHILSMCMKNLSNFKAKRLFFASDGTTATGDFTDTGTTFTILEDLSSDFPAISSVVEVIYGTTAAATFAQSVHPLSSVKPGAVRGKDCRVQVWTGDATPVALNWSGVQSIQADWKVNLEADDELGNPNHVTYTYDIPEVTGNIVVRSFDTTDLFDKIAQIADTDTDVVIGPYSSVPVQVDMTVLDPETGDPLKTIYIPDARFTIPALQGRVSSKLDVTFNFQSDTGSMLVYEGSRL